MVLNNTRKIFFGLSLFVFVCSSQADDKDMADAFVAHAIEEGFIGVSFADFNEGGDRAYTVKRTPEGSIDKVAMYTAELNDRADGNVYVSFRMRDKCEVTMPEPGVIERVFTINDQRVNMNYGCAVSSEQEQTLFSDTVALMWPVSDKGKNYIRDLFFKKSWVFLRYEGVEIPFRAIGFTDLWNRLSKPAF